MNHPRDEIDPLVAELESLRPARPSAGLAAGIERELAGRASPAGPRPHRRPAMLYWIGGAAAAAACVAAALTWRQPGPVANERAVVVEATRPAAPRAVADDRPALSNYRRAASLSADAFDELLDRHSARTLADPATAPVTVSSRDLMLP